MPTFTSTRDIFRLEGVTLSDLGGAELPAGAQLTRVNLVAIDELNPDASQNLQDNDARNLSSGFFSAQTAQPVRVGEAEAATFIIDGQVVSSSVPQLFSLDFIGNPTLTLQTNGGSLFSPRL